MNTQKRMRPFGWRDKLGYMFGDLGNDFTFVFASTFLMVFYTKVLGIRAETVGVLFLVSRCVDAFTDVGMGRIVDRMKIGKNGYFKPWILRVCGPVAIASFLMYQSGMASAPMTVKIVYMYVTYILWGSIFYTAINIPYGSMVSVISEEADERAALSTFRGLGATLASLIIGIVAPLLIYTTDVNGNEIVNGGRMTLVAGLFSIASIICYLICYFWTTERVKKEVVASEAKGLRETLKRLVTDRALLGIILAAVLLLLSSSLTQTMNQYVFIDYFNNKNGISLMTIVSMIPTFVLLPLIGPIVKRYGKKEASAVGCFLAGAASIVLYFLHVKSMAIFIAITTVGYIGFGFFNLVIWSFITDVIDEQEVKTGKREDGTIYAIYSFARKIGQAAAGGLGGFALAMTGYNAAVQVQTKDVSDGIYNVATLFPGLLYVGVGLALLFVYPLNKKRVDENVEVLRVRHEGRK